MSNLCIECEEREAKFSVKGGPLKSDKFHTLCRQCFDSQKERIKSDLKNSIEVLSWHDKKGCYDRLLQQGKVFLQGSKKYDISIQIIINDYGTEVLLNNSIINEIPGLSIITWNKTSSSFVKHWLVKVLDENYIQNANLIEIEARGSWRSKL